MAVNSKLLVIQVAGLGYKLANRYNLACRGLSFRPMETVFPALTCPVQASFRTAAQPSAHGVVANGSYLRDLKRTAFWEQSATLVHGPRIWDLFRQRGRKVAILFWQQSLGESADIILSPAPIHKHHGGMIEGCYSKPADLYARLCRQIGRPFRLAHYWGPCASIKSSQWIAEATAALLLDPAAPDLCLTYLPALDYDLQRYAMNHPAVTRAIEALRSQLDMLADSAARAGYELLIFGDYAIAACDRGPLFPNRALYDAGFLRTRTVKGMLYPDFYESHAFALCDHEVAHVYIRQPDVIPAVKSFLAALPNVANALTEDEQVRTGIQHRNSGEIVMVAADGYWFAYPWWTRRGEAPEYAGHVDIHNKPGYDPCELFHGWPPGFVSRNASRIRGSHGCVGATRKTCWASTLFSGNIGSVVELANRVQEWLNNP